MKHPFRLFAFLAAAALPISPLFATDDFAAGDLALVFYSLSGDAPGVFGTEYYVFNLGATASFRENTQNNVPVKTVNDTISDSNIAADLESVFGPDWAEEGSVRMMVVSAIRQDGVLTNGDPTRTFYFSAPRTSLNSDQTGPDAESTFIYRQGNPNNSTLSSGFRQQVSNSISGFLYTATNGTIATGNPLTGANPSGVRLTTSQSDNLSGYIPPADVTYFKLGVNPTAVLGAGKLPGTANVEAAVDVFRVLHTATNADLTSGSSSGDAIVGQGQFIGSITLDSSGNLKVQAVGASTPIGSFASWATTNGVTGGPNGDSDQDGIPNLTEYALALNPAASDGTPGTYVGDTLTFTKRAEAVTNGDVTYSIQQSADLGITDPWHTVTPTTDTPTTISYQIPSGAARTFARLKIATTP